MHCALVPDAGETSVGSLNPFNASLALSGAFVTLIPAGPLNTTSVGTAPISRTALLENMPLGMNLSLALGGTIHGDPVLDGWRVVGSVVNVFHPGLFVPVVERRCSCGSDVHNGSWSQAVTADLARSSKRVVDRVAALASNVSERLP